MMLYEMKYIMLNRTIPILFSPALVHKEVAGKLKRDSDVITGAGFVRMDENGEIRCYGCSETLASMGPGRHDSKMIEKILKGGPL